MESVVANQSSSVAKFQKFLESQDVGPRMLCLDGGGIRGLVSAMVVEELEKILNQAIIKKNDFLLMAESSLDDPDGSGETHHEQQKFIREIREKLPKKSPEGQFIRLWHLFDVVIGTSTGSLLAYGIGMTRLSGYECRGLYEILADEIFKDYHHFSMLREAKYENKNLKKELQKFFPYDLDMTRINSIPITASCSYNMDKGHISLSATAGLADEDVKDMVLGKCILASAAAPTYFPSVEHNGEKYVDGGLGANCPVYHGYRLGMRLYDYEAAPGERPDLFYDDTKYENMHHPAFVPPGQRYQTRLCLSIGTGGGTEIDVPSKCLGWFQGLARVVSQAEGLWRVVEPMMEKLNKFGCFNRINPSPDDPNGKKIAEFKLDNTDVKTLGRLAEQWLSEECTQMQLKEVAMQLIAKNYYLDFSEIGKGITPGSNVLIPLSQITQSVFDFDAGHFVPEAYKVIRDLKEKSEDITSECKVKIFIINQGYSPVQLGLSFICPDAPFVLVVKFKLPGMGVSKEFENQCYINGGRRIFLSSHTPTGSSGGGSFEANKTLEPFMA